MHAHVQESWAKLMPLQILQGGIQPWAPAGGGQEEALNRPHPPLKNQGNFLPVIWGNFCFIFSMWGLFYYVFLIIVIVLRGGGAIVGNRPPLKICYLHGRLFAAFSLPFFPCEGFFATFFSL